VAKAAIISAVPPLMVKTPANPGGLPKQVFDDFQAQLASNRSEFYRVIADGPFYNYNKPSTKRSEAIIQNWWRQGMMGGARAHYDGVEGSPSGLMLLSDFSDEQEQEADWYAGSFLLPRDGIYRLRTRGKTAADIAVQFGVSKALCEYRLRMTGVDIQMRRVSGR
jgi:hypothetical protein